LFITLTLLVGILMSQDDWKLVADEDGVEVSELEVEGRSMPIFRGVVDMDGGLYEVLAVIHDADNHTEWMANCKDARLLRSESKTVSYVYNLTNAPWPVSDRDVIVRTEIVVVDPNREVHAFFRSTGNDLMDPVKGVVRMEHLEGHYKLWALDADHTRVEYQADADPGGRIPTWLVRSTTRDTPLWTLRDLRKRVTETRGSYEEFLDEWDPSRH
jgi:hypothetical protein